MSTWEQAVANSQRRIPQFQSRVGETYEQELERFNREVKEVFARIPEKWYPKVGDRVRFPYGFNHGCYHYDVNPGFPKLEGTMIGKNVAGQLVEVFIGDKRLVVCLISSVVFEKA